MSERTKTLLYIAIFIIVIGTIGMILMRIKVQPKSEINQLEQAEILEVGEDTFEAEVLQSTKKVLVDFYATWCGPCRILKPTIMEFAKEHEEVKVVEVDVDKAQNLSNKYGVISIPTVVIIENGKEINRVVGAVSKEKLMEICGL